MSGGSFDYAYQRIHELESWVSTLEQMAARCREWAASDGAATKYDREAKGDVPSSFEDRARIMVRAMLLERAATRLRDAVKGVSGLETVMHDVEWVDSGDCGVDCLMGPIKD